jgi:hypothetical protein
LHIKPKANFDCLILLVMRFGRKKQYQNDTRLADFKLVSCVRLFMRLKARLRDNHAVQGGICRRLNDYDWQGESQSEAADLLWKSYSFLALFTSLRRM